MIKITVTIRKTSIKHTTKSLIIIILSEAHNYWSFSSKSRASINEVP